MNKALDYNGYTLHFEEHFDEQRLDRSVWNVETHESGWVNQEWQEYIDSEKVLSLQNSSLVIRPIKEHDRYYSARVTTEGKRSFIHGIFEARFRTPKGKGFLPAFWLMSENEQEYGCWPRCGEIDIAEVMGEYPSRLYSTIHYGLPHKQTQGYVDLKKDDFSNNFHTVSLVWAEKEMGWYLDGELYFSVSDWYATDRSNQPSRFPAPFDHAMYLILNLAVGGEWVGYPDETTDFEHDEVFEIDYVRVYQKEMKS